MTPRWKVVLDSDGPDLLFDLDRDPFELTSVHGDHPDTLEALRSVLLRELARQDARREFFYAEAGSTEEVSVDPETMQQLRALGYAD